jgi:hypothetical protein
MTSRAVRDGTILGPPPVAELAACLVPAVAPPGGAASTA